MRTVDNYNAKTELSPLLTQATQKKLTKRLGFMEREILVPENFDSMGHIEIEQMFSVA